MSLFTKRKGRRISTRDDEDDAPSAASSPGGENDDGNAPDPVVQPIRFGKRPLKQSALRRSIHVDDGEGDAHNKDANASRAGDDATSSRGTDTSHGAADGEDEGPVVVRPTLSRSGSRHNRKRLSTASTTSRLSFGGLGDDDDGGDAHTETADGRRRPASAVVTPKKAPSGGASLLTQRVLETNAFRRSLSSRLPTRERLHNDDDDDDDDDVGDAARRNRGDHGDGDDGRPRYSQAYLDELESSTPNTPQNLGSARRLRGADDGSEPMDADLDENNENDENDGMGDTFDASELEGAMVVDAAELSAVLGHASASALATARGVAPAAHVLTATEIQERKDRRARRALEEAAAGDGSNDGDDDESTGYISLLTEAQKRRRREKEATRLVREDEDLGEGFDAYVDEGTLALGRRAERAARHRRQQEMAALIDAAEGRGDDDGGGGGGGGGDIGGDDAATATRGTPAVPPYDDSDDSEAERRAAYDAAQTRAGMGGGGGGGLGLRVPPESRASRASQASHGTHGAHSSHALRGDASYDDVPIPKMRPLPDLAACLRQMRSAVEALETRAAEQRRRLAEIDKEKAEIAAREAEVQAVLDAAASKYQSVLGTAAGTKPAGMAPGAATATATQTPLRALPLGQSPLRPLPPGWGGDMPVERGLESLGTTPTRRSNTDDAL